MKFNSFKHYLEVRQHNSFTDRLEDELGINPDGYEQDVHWAGNITLGNFTYNGITYSFKWVKDGKGETTGAMVKVKSPDRVYSKTDSDKYVRVPGDPKDEKEFFVPLEKMTKLLNQGNEAGSETPSVPAIPGGIGGLQ